MIKIAVDAMGSDLGPSEIVRAVVNFLRDYDDVSFIVCGQEKALETLKNEKRVIIANASGVMGMEDGALEVMRRKDTSMMKAIDLVAKKEADAVVSAGSTGAFLTGATLKLKLIPGVMRAALAAPFPTKNGKSVTILDIGANNENQPEHLVQFAKMGKILHAATNDTSDPRIYLLSNGAEEKKGSPLVKKAHLLLKNEPGINFRGNIEAREVLSGDADVVVADGYSGNVLLKATEGVASMMNGMIKDAFKTNTATKIGYLFAKKGFQIFKERMDYKKYGGAMLLGVNGIVVKGHGNSDAYAFYNAIRVAYSLAKIDAVNVLRKETTNG